MCSALPSALQLAELLRGGDPRPDDLSEIHDRSSVLALPDELVSSMAQRSHSQHRDEPHRMPLQPTDGVIVQRHFAADPRFKVRCERA